MFFLGDVMYALGMNTTKKVSIPITPLYWALPPHLYTEHCHHTFILSIASTPLYWSRPPHLLSWALPPHLYTDRGHQTFYPEHWHHTFILSIATTPLFLALPSHLYFEYSIIKYSEAQLKGKVSSVLLNTEPSTIFLYFKTFSWPLLGNLVKYFTRSCLFCKYSSG